MSLETWKKEFYPVPANRVSKKNATAHSLKKWQGLLKKNLKKHGLVCYGGEIGPSESSENYKYWDNFHIDSESCALCEKFFNGDAVGQNICAKCPLYKVLGNVSCASWDDKTKREGPFEIYIQTDNPVPMIKALEKTLAYEKKGK